MWGLDVLTDDAIAARFEAVADWLKRERSVWSVPPFRDRAPAWTRDHPALAAWLLSRTEAQVSAIEQGAEALGAPDPWPERAAEVAVLTDVGPLIGHPWLPQRHPLARRMKTRKWSQVRGFLSVVEPRLEGTDGAVVEGCSGRGHLGRTLAQHLSRQAVLLEVDAALCAPAHGAAEVEGVRHVCVDVLGEAAPGAVPKGSSVVALHACGRLTDRLIALAEGAEAERVAVAPCCPHRQFGQAGWAPASRAGAAHALALTSDDLRLAITDEVVATPRRRHLRQRELMVRSMVDELAREATGEDRYFGFPSVPRTVFDQPLASAIREVDAKHPLRLPAGWDQRALEGEAAALVRRIRALALYRGLARRPLELWTVLDRAQGLVERGWQVEVGTFCAPTDSPRNLVVVGRRDRASVRPLAAGAR